MKRKYLFQEPAGRTKDYIGGKIESSETLKINELAKNYSNQSINDLEAKKTYIENINVDERISNEIRPKSDSLDILELEVLYAE